jgi:hypothetical protein
MQKIYDLQKIENIREILPREDSHFTPWIANNLYKINNLLGLDLELLEQEASCGRYRLDIKAKNQSDDSVAVIENQYEYTDHDHLGKLITYASGFDANYMIWITENYNEEHRAAIDWLNEISHENISFFLLQVEFVKINDSKDIASNFKIICKPNTWSKTIKERNSANTSEKGKELIDFWTNLQGYAVDNHYQFTDKLRRPYAKRWNILPINSPLAELNMNITLSKAFVNLYIHESKELFEYLLSNKEEIESKLDFKLIWNESEGSKKFEILIENNNLNYKNDNIEVVYKWLLDKLDKMRNVFPEYVREFENIQKNTNN